MDLRRIARLAVLGGVAALALPAPRAAELPRPAPAWTAESDNAFASFGRAVAGVGDVNGDGFDDVAVGAYLFDGDQQDEGRLYLYFGGVAGLSDTAFWTLDGNQFFAQLGWSIDGAGDVNGDGFAEIIVGAPRYRGGELDEGGAFLYLGDSVGPGQAPAWSAEGDQIGAMFGGGVAGAGDVNGDGFDDVIVGAPRFVRDLAEEGRAFLFLGGGLGLAADTAWTMDGRQAFAHFGAAVAGVGDVNGDGFDDVVIAADQFTDGDSLEGAAFLFFGTSTGLARSPAWIVEGNQALAGFGCAVAAAGDVNADGFDDVIIGASGYDGTGTDAGRAYLFLGTATGLSSKADWSADGGQSFAAFGAAVGGAGDVNSDGFDDVVVGAYLYDNPDANEGGAYVFLGGPGGPAPAPGWSLESDQALAWFGRAVAGAGDVNGDSYGDVVIGAPQYDNGQPAEGRAFLYEGTDVVPVVLQAFSARWDGARVVLEWSLWDVPPDVSFGVSRRAGRETLFKTLTVTGIERSGGRFAFRDPGAVPGETYTYAVRVLDGLEVVASFQVEVVTAEAASAIDPVYPNPFNPSTRIRFVVGAPGRVTLAVYDVAGHRVRALADGPLAAGTYVRAWDGRGDDGTEVPSGVYFFRLVSGRRAVLTKGVLLR